MLLPHPDGRVHGCHGPFLHVYWTLGGGGEDGQARLLKEVYEQRPETHQTKPNKTKQNKTYRGVLQLPPL